MALYDLNFYDLIIRGDQSFSSRTAWAEDASQITFAEYKKDADSLAAGLSRLGVKKQDTIAVIAKNSYEFFMIYGAAAAIGAIVVPINWRLSDQEILFNIKDSGSSILFLDIEFEEKLKEIKESIGFIKRTFNLKEKGSFEDFGSLCEKSDFTPAEVHSDDGFVIIYTAAVAGRPRGALVSHGNVVFGSKQWGSDLGITKESVNLNCLPMFHVAGLFMLSTAFMAGALNVNMPKFDADMATSLIEEKKVSFFFDFAPILSSLLDAAEKNGKNIESLKTLTGIDSPDTIERYQNMTGGTFYCMYGQTETSSLGALGPYNDMPGSAGKIVSMASVSLHNSEGEPVETGQTGEIVMRGPLVFCKYWNLPDDTVYTFRGGWHHTGDLGRLDKDGFLFYMGRKAEKELIKPGGENVYPAEVEQAILQHPDVEKTVVFGVPDPKWKEGIKAVCVLKSGSNLSEKELIKFTGTKIASFKKPQYVEFIDSMPTLKDGTPDREKVKKLYG